MVCQSFKSRGLFSNCGFTLPGSLIAVTLSILIAFAGSAQMVAQQVGPPIIFVHGICSHPTDWDQLRLSLSAYLNTNETSLYPNTQVYVGVATGPSAADVYFYDDSGNQLSSVPPSNGRFFSIAFNPDAFGAAQQCPFCNPITFDTESVMQQSIKQKGDELAAFIARIKQITGVPKVILVAHSMGGLDARSYLENLGAMHSHIQGRDSDVIEVTTIDTPDLGSPLASLQSNTSYISFVTQYLPGSSACMVDQSEDTNELAPGSLTMRDLNYQSNAAADIPNTVSFDSMVNYVYGACQGLFPNNPYCLEEPAYIPFGQDPNNDGAVSLTSQNLTNALISYPFPSGPHIIAPSTPFMGTCPSGTILHLLGCVGVQQNTQLQLDVDVINSLLNKSISVEPQNATIASGQTQQFTVSLSDSTPVVNWMLLEDPASTSIDSYGTFHAGSTGTFHVVAADQASGKQYGIATVTVVPNQAPTVATIAATSVSSTNATLNGAIYANGSATQFLFLYGTDSQLNGAAATETYRLTSDNSLYPTHVGVSGLSPGKVYYFQLEAWNLANSSATPSLGGILSFSTPSAGKETPTVSVTTSSSSITTTQAMSVTISVTGSNGTPTGSIRLSTGAYVSGSVALSNGSASLSISAGQLPIGTDTLTASYIPDSSSSSVYTDATGMAAVSVGTPAKTTPTVAVSPLATNITTAQGLTVNVSVYTSNGSVSPSGNVTLTIGSYTSPATLLVNAGASVYIPPYTLTAGTYTATANYSGDGNYNSASGRANNSVTVTGGTTANLTVSVSGNGTVTTTDGQINCPGSCSHDYAVGTTLTLMANPASGYYDQWTGCDGISTGCLITMAQSRSVSIIFTQQPKGIMLVQPSGLSFSPQLVGTSNVGPQSNTQIEFVIANGLAALDPITASVGGSNASDFAMMNSCPAYGLNSGECEISITFTPSGLGPRSASLTVSSANATVTPQIEPLSGAGVVNPTVFVTPSDSGITSNQPLTLDVTVSGDYGAPSGFLRVSGGGFNRTGIPLNNGSAAVNIAAGSLTPGTDAIWVYYDPDAASSTIYNYASASVPVVVTGATSYLAPTEPIGTTSPTQTATILFASSVTPGSITATTLGAANLDFNLASGGTCAVGIAYTAGQTCTENYTFTPSAPGTRMGAINVYDNASPAPHLVSTIYVSGIGTGPQMAFSPDVQSTILPLITQEDPGGIAVDGSGNLYIADYDNNKVLKETVSGGKYSESTIGTDWDQPRAIALDGAGNVYVAESGMNRVVMETLSGGGYLQSTIASGLGYPSGVAIDGSGNVYIADSQNNQIRIETLTMGGYVQSTIPTSGLNWPNEIAVDGNGDIYIADQYNDRVVKESLSANGYTQSTIKDGLNDPRGVAVDVNGDVYIADSQNNQVLKAMPSGAGYAFSTIGNAVSYPCWLALDGRGNLLISGYSIVKEESSDAPSLSFAPTANVTTSANSPQTDAILNSGNALSFAPAQGGTISSDSPKKVTIMNLGNSNLKFSAVKFPQDFPEAAGEATDCTSSTTLGAGASCTLNIDFSPQPSSAKGFSTLLNESLSLSDNNLNASNAEQSVGVSGTELIPTSALSSPTPGSALTGPAATFNWTSVAGATSYVLHLGTTTGGSDLRGTGTTTATSVTFSGLPTNGETIYARLYTFVGSNSAYSDYTFTAVTQAALTSPAPGSTLTDTATTFRWTAVTGASGYVLHLGTTLGASDLRGTGTTTATSAIFTGLPTNGETIYARLYTNFASGTRYTDYVFTAATQSMLTSPAPNSVLTDTAATFTWTSVNGASSYILYLGTSQGGKDLRVTGTTKATSITFSGLPTNGEKIYARLYTDFASGIRYTDYMFTAATQSVLTSPAPNSQLTGSKVSFDWTTVTGATGYVLHLGTTQGGNNLKGSGVTTATTITFSGLPTNGETIYARLYTYFASGSRYTDYVLTAAN